MAAGCWIHSPVQVALSMWLVLFGSRIDTDCAESGRSAMADLTSASDPSTASWCPGHVFRVSRNGPEWKQSLSPDS